MTVSRVEFVPAKVAPGATTTLEIVAEPDAGWHFYGALEEIGLPPDLALDPKTWKDHLIRKGGFEVGDGKRHDSGGGFISYWLEGEQTFRQQFTVPADAAPGEFTIAGVFKFMVCDPTMCLPPDEVDISAVVKIAEAIPASTIGPNTGHVKIKALTFDPPRVAGGGETVLKIEVEPDFGWHYYGAKEEYGQPPSVTLDLPAGLTRKGGLEVPDGEPHVGIGVTSYWVAKKTVLTQRIAVDEDAEPGVRTVSGVVTYIACNDRLCDAEIEVPVGASFAVDPEGLGATEDSGAGDGAAAQDGNGDGTGDGGVEEQSLPLFLLGAFFAGLLALIMPCTYPMIPITISFFTKQAADRGGSVLPLSMAYGAGIIGIFVAIGLAVGPVIVRFAMHPVTNLLIGIVFVIFALSLFGVFYLSAPAFLMRGASKASQTGGYLGVFLMGMTLCVTSFTCTAPFVGTLLSVGAKTGSFGRIALGMGVFGLTMAIPFVFLSMVPSRLQKMPKSGEWMVTFKVALGFVELAAALKFFSTAETVWQLQILPRELFLMICAAIFLAGSLYLFGFIKLKGSSGEIGPGRMVAGIVFFVITAALFYGAQGFRFDNIVMNGLEPPYSAAQVGGRASRGGDAASLDRHIIVENDYDEALRVASEKKLAVMVNFTGYS